MLSPFPHLDQVVLVVDLVEVVVLGNGAGALVLVARVQLALLRVRKGAQDQRLLCRGVPYKTTYSSPLLVKLVCAACHTLFTEASTT